MLKISLAVAYADGRKQDVVAGPGVQVAFEREHNVGIAAIATEQKVSHVYWLAWKATKASLPFDEWLDTVDDIELEVGTPDPTRTAPSGGSSPS